MNRETRLHRPPFGIRPEPTAYETGDYTLPEPVDARFAAPDDPLVATDFEDGETTTITRHR
jgi:hypothetical protein